MAIAFDAITNTAVSAVSSISFNHTITGSNPILFVATSINRGSGDFIISGVTYNSVALSKIDVTNYAKNDTSTGVAGRVELWYLAAPATGINSVAITYTGSTTGNAHAFSYTGVDQASPIGVVATATASAGASPATISLTTGTNNSWVVSVVETFGDVLSVPSDTQRANYQNGMQTGIEDELQATAGAVTESWTVASQFRWSMVATEFKVATAVAATASTANHLMLIGVG